MSQACASPICKAYRARKRQPAWSSTPRSVSATQLIFVLSGVALLLIRSTEHNALVVAGTVLIGTGIFFVAIAAFVLFQHRGLFTGFAKFTRRLLPEKWLSAFAASASTIDAAVVAAYRSGPVMLRASLLRLIGWVAGAGEIWLVMQSLGHSFGMVDAFILESLSSGVRAAAFMLPGALGALEGSSVLFGALFGLPADTALAISLSKRVRELALGLPGLLSGIGSKAALICAVASPMHEDQGTLMSTTQSTCRTPGRPASQYLIRSSCLPTRRSKEPTSNGRRLARRRRKLTHRKAIITARTRAIGVRQVSGADGLVVFDETRAAARLTIRHYQHLSHHD